MSNLNIDWTQKHLLKTNTSLISTSDDIVAQDLRTRVEPWLSAVFQSDHLSLLVGAGLTTAVSFAAGVTPQQMGRFSLPGDLGEKIRNRADETAGKLARGEANLEDDFRATLETLAGLEILGDDSATNLRKALNDELLKFIRAVLQTESKFLEKLNDNESDAIESFQLLKSFISSFASRAPSRDRLNIFTTNYDRFIELACDDTGVLLLDRFKGKLRPLFRNTRLELDYHYNPPGIRGEPRYVEGVSRITKLHGSVDWLFDGARIFRALLPFGAAPNHPVIPSDAAEHVVIYPNSAKDIETSFYPYAELFRDYSSALCQPNSVLVTYGYGFGDSHINRVIEDMLTVPSTHLIVIAWDKANPASGDVQYGPVRDRIRKFLEGKNRAQITLLIGEHFGDLNTLVEYYLPKAALDTISIKMQKLKENRGHIIEPADVTADASDQD